MQYLDGARSPLYSLQFVGVQREAADVTYFSHGYQCAWWSNCSDPAHYYSWNTSAGTTWGTLLALGSFWGASVAAQDASGKTLAAKFERPAQ